MRTVFVSIVRSIEFAAVVLCTLLLLEFANCAVSESYRREAVATWRQRNPDGVGKMRLGGDAARKEIYRSFREDHIHTGRALIAAIMM